MKITILGTGTSHGVPAIACDCDVCRSSDIHDKRLRSSVFIEHDGANILVDIGPDFRTQALKAHLTKINAVLLTHSHADHLHGLDDIRIFSHTKSDNHGASRPITLYANSETLEDVKVRFNYVFHSTQLGGGKPLLNLKDATIFNKETPAEFGSMKITAIPMMHGTIKTTGYIFSIIKNGEVHSFSYLTDCNYISDESFKKITDNAGVIDYLIIDGLKETAHSTHFSFLEALDAANKIAPRNTLLTHICHKMAHEDIKKYIAAHIAQFPALSEAVTRGGLVSPAYDGETLFI